MAQGVLQGKVVLMTGAARGIGRYAAATFARAGAQLALADVLPLSNTSKDIEDGGLTRPLELHVDVRQEESVRSMVKATVERYGRIDVLVNDAAIVTHPAWKAQWPRVRDMDLSFWQDVMGTNLGGTFLVTKHVLPYMEQQRAGHVINVYGGGRPTPHGACAYVTSKDAIRTFTRYVAAEERELGICIVAVSPGGAIATEDAPASVREQMPGVDVIGQRFVLAAQVGLDVSGETLVLTQGRLEIVR